MGRLRRALANPSPPLLLGLKYLQTVGILISLLAIVLGVSIAVVTSISLTQFAANVDYTSKASDRLVMTFNAIINLQTLVWAAKGWIPQLTASDESELRTSILGNTSAFIDLHKHLYAYIETTNRASDYTTRYITAYRFDTPSAGKTGELQVLNLFEAGIELAAAVTQVAATPLSNLSNDFDPNVRWSLINGVPAGNVHEQIHHSIELGSEMSMDAYSGVLGTQKIVFGSMISLLAVIAVLVFLPILISIEKAKDAIVIQFVELPMMVRGMLYKQAMLRVRTLRRNYVNTEEDDSGSDSSSEDGNQAAALGDASNNDSRVINGDGDEDGGEDTEAAGAVDWRSVLRNSLASPIIIRRKWQAAERAVAGSPDVGEGSSGGTADPASGTATGTAPSPAGFKRSMRLHATSTVVAGSGSGSGGRATRSRKKPARSGPAYRKSWHSFGFLIAFFIGPLGALAVFFTVIFASTTVMTTRALTLSSVATAAAQRASCTRETDMDIRRALMAYADRPLMQNQWNLVDDTANCMQYHMRLLAFGRDPALPDRGLYALYTAVVESGAYAFYPIDLTTTIYNAIFSDACPFIAIITTSPAFTLERCGAFGGGVVKQGLYSLSNEYETRVGRINDRHLRSRFVYNWTNYTGFMVDALYYNRTQDACNADASCLPSGPAYGNALPPPPDPDPAYFGDVPANFLSTAAAPPLTVPYSIAAEVKSADMLWVEEVDKMYLYPAFLAISLMYGAQSTGFINSFTSFVQVFTGAFMAAFVLLMAVVFLPAVRATNTDIQTKRAMLMYLPPEIVAASPEIKELVRSILASDAASGEGVGPAVTSSSQAASKQRAAEAAAEAAAAAAASNALSSEEGGAGGFASAT